jgi:hypothetical protein
MTRKRFEFLCELECLSRQTLKLAWWAVETVPLSYEAWRALGEWVCQFPRVSLVSWLGGLLTRCAVETVPLSWWTKQRENAWLHLNTSYQSRYVFLHFTRFPSGGGSFSRAHIQGFQGGSFFLNKMTCIIIAPPPPVVVGS